MGMRRWSRRPGEKAEDVLNKTNAELWGVDAARLEANDRQVLAEKRLMMFEETTHGADGSASEWLSLNSRCPGRTARAWWRESR